MEAITALVLPYLTPDNIVALLSFIYGVVLYFLSPEKAKKINIIASALKKIADTPAGFKWKAYEKKEEQ